MLSDEENRERNKRISQLNVLIDSLTACGFRGMSVRKVTDLISEYKYPEDDLTQEFLLYAKELSAQLAGEKFLTKLRDMLSDGAPKTILNICMNRNSKPRSGQVEINRSVREVIKDLEKYAPYATVSRGFANGAEVINISVYQEDP